jgi:glutathione peroxidase
MKSFYDFKAIDIRGKEHKMSEYKGKVLLIVNVASQCGFTPQYKALQRLYSKYKNRDFEVLAFPSNQFRGQEPKSEIAIEQFCQVNYGVTFPLFSKIEVNGKNTHPLYQFLKKEAKGFLGTQSIKWNFTKFLIDRDGNVVTRYGSTVKPQEIEPNIETLLKEFVLTV